MLFFYTHLQVAFHVSQPVQTFAAWLAGAGEAPILARDVAAATHISLAAAQEYLGRLARQGKLARRGPGVFTLPRAGPPTFEPTAVLKRASSVLRRELPLTPVVGWSTEWLAPYAHNVPTRHWTVLETAAYALQSVADLLSRARLQAVVDPDPEAVPDLLRLFDRPCILWPHGDLYGAPPRPGLRLPRPERLLVDLYFAVTRRGLPYPENDLALVVSRFVVERDLNVATILAYASRRKIGREMTDYLQQLPRVPPDVAHAIVLVAGRSRRKQANAKADAQPRPRSRQPS